MQRKSMSQFGLNLDLLKQKLVRQESEGKKRIQSLLDSQKASKIKDQENRQPLTKQQPELYHRISYLMNCKAQMLNSKTFPESEYISVNDYIKTQQTQDTHPLRQNNFGPRKSQGAVRSFLTGKSRERESRVQTNCSQERSNLSYLTNKHQRTQTLNTLPNYQSNLVEKSVDDTFGQIVSPYRTNTRCGQY